MIEIYYCAETITSCGVVGTLLLFTCLARREGKTEIPAVEYTEDRGRQQQQYMATHLVRLKDKHKPNSVRKITLLLHTIFNFKINTLTQNTEFKKRFRNIKVNAAQKG